MKLHQWLSEQTIHVDYNGKTNLHNRYAPFPQSKTVKGSKTPGYTLARSRSTIRSVARVHSFAAQLGKQHTYLITHTMAAGNDQHTRRKMFSKFLNMIRTEQGYRGHFWVCERHKSGELHHHALLRFKAPLLYRHKVVAWSLRYCDSTNGLDIQSIRSSNSHAFGYLTKAVSYLCKNDNITDRLPFRWWGTSKIVRSTDVLSDEFPLMQRTHYIRPPGWSNECAYTCHIKASIACAQATLKAEDAMR